MAMSRKPSMNFISNGMAPSFLPGMRGSSVFDHEKEEFDKAQVAALTKCLSLEEAAAKEKHVRTLIIGTFKSGGAQVFWQKVKDNVPLHSSDVVCWKFLIVLHRLMQDGHASVPKGSRSYCGFIDEIVNSHKQSKLAYGRLSYSYGGLIISKLLFHAKYPNIPGNLTIKDQSLVKNDAANNFELAIDFLDLLERVIKVKRIILSTFDPGKAHSSTASGQCRLSALVPCINDSGRLFDLLSKTLKVLHRALPWDTLEGHRQRFKLQYAALEDLYDKLDHFHYLKSMANIPKLSGNLTEFMDSLYRMPDVPESPPDFPIEDSASSVGHVEQDLITVDDTVDTSLAYVQQEYSDLSIKYQALIHSLTEERSVHENSIQEQREREQRLLAEIESLRQENQEMVFRHRESLEAATIAAAANQASSVATEANEEKMEKLKAAYQKLRSDHIVLLRQKADIEKAAKNQDDLAELQDLLRSSSLTNRPLNNRHDLLELTKQLLLERNDAEKTFKEKNLLINQLENEKRILDLESSERNLLLKEELENMKKRDVPELKEKVDELQQSNNALAMKNQQLTQQLEAHEAKSEALAAIWRDKLMNQYSLLFNRLISSGLPPDLESIFGPAFGDPNAIVPTNCDTAASRLGRLHDILFYVTFSIMQLQPLETNDDLGNLFKASSELCQIALNSKESDLPEKWLAFLHHAKTKLGTVSGITDYGPANEVEREIHEMQQSINEAAKAMEKLMLEAKADEANRPNLDVDLKIIDSCSQLLMSVQEMIKSARHLQREITEESNIRKPSSMTSAKDHYKKNQKWSEGLISAAKDIGGGAKLLVDSADHVVHGEGKFEELIAASQEIAGSTAQLVIASKVKARQESEHLSSLKTTSKSVAEATAQVIATCRTCNSQDNQDANVDISQLSVHQSKRLEMEIQIKVLQLETQLEQQRKQLFELRKLQYANASSSSGSASNEQA